MIQDLVGSFVPAFRSTRALIPSSPRQGSRDGLGLVSLSGRRRSSGGINSLWPLFGIANQMLAAIALTLCAVVLFRMKREAYAIVALAR